MVNADLETHEFYLEKVSQEERIPKKIKLIFSKENIGDIKMLLGGPNRGNASYERQVIFQDVYSNGGFLYNYQTELGRNLNFRKAISLALDREKISEATVFKEMAPEDQMLPNSGWQKDYRFPMPIQKQNIAEAKRLLNLVPEHLWKNKVFQVPSYWEDVKEINTLPYISVIKKQLQDIGIAVEFLNTDMDYDKFKEEIQMSYGGQALHLQAVIQTKILLILEKAVTLAMSIQMILNTKNFIKNPLKM